MTFDLEKGQVELADGEPQLMVPASALASMLAGHSGGRTLGRAIGVSAMGRVAMRMARGPSVEGDGRRAREKIRAAALETIVELLGGELAIVGLGNLRVERWGEALLFVLDPHPLDGRANELVCGVFEGALASVTEREVVALVIDRAENQLRVLVANKKAIARAQRMVAGGAFFTEIVSKLHESEQGPS